MLIWEAAMFLSALPAALVLADFNAPASDWRAINDGVMGGRSDRAGRIEGARLRFTGVLRTQGR